MKKSAWLLLLIPLSIGTFAQKPDASFERDYQLAVSHYKSANYQSAMSEFAPLTGARHSNVLVPYAHYYYAASANQLNRLNESRQSLEQLQNRFPSWPAMDEAHYLLADVYFKLKQYEAAMSEASEITDGKLKTDLEGMKRHYLSQVRDLGLLKSLNRAYPSDRALAMTLIDVIQSSSNEKSDLELSDNLTNRFGVTPANVPTKPSQVVPIRQSDKGYFNVAVILPFNLDKLNIAERVKANQYAYDLYEGMKMAKTKLQQEGVVVNLFAYDIGNDANELLETVNNSNFSQTDLMIGPVYPEPSKIAAGYAESSKTYVILPTTMNAEALINREYTLLYRPSLERQTTRTFELAKSITSGKKVAIYYSNTRRDSTLATAYRAKAMAAGMQIVDFRKTREKIDSTATISSINAPNHVALFSGNDYDGAKVINMLNKRQVGAPLFASMTAFDLSRATSFGNHQVYLIDPDFVDNNKQSVKDFQAAYFSKRNTIPSVYTMQGYDIMLFSGRLLQKHKTQLRSGLDAKKYEDDYLLSGFDYTNSNENKVVPIVKLEDLRLVPVED
jgi:ABC-type branched-subunit amino acid transport system substrate-binding protein